ncbi:GDNF-inducible zinc finger protein 1-like [Ostrinia furnacalis]|uniref:GDNF-inducible zinc finger protein 1-like n=1 Tax=Ostrinia furnacalis TaxID=93504 RepID=UPI00103C975E|nr:GDNF-inducible zinc finger protein 1-like [Ostrinia furnacalis]
MVLPSEMVIKQEKEDLEHNPADYLSPDFEVTVKVEVESSQIREYEVKTEFIGDENTEVFESEEVEFDGVEYEDLIQYTRVTCAICNEEFCERYSLLRHNLKHLRLLIEPLGTIIQKDNNNVPIKRKKSLVTKELHECKICGKIQTYKTWHSHMKEVHGTEEYECSVCSAVFKCARYARKHIYSIHMNKKFKGSRQIEGVEVKCTLCPAILKSKYALSTHMRNCHSEKAQCEICQSVLKSRSYLLIHMNRVHYNDGKEHKCHCGKKFRSPRYLKIHMKNSKHARR